MSYVHICLGVSGSGKDTVAGLLSETQSVQNIKFSEPMKRMLEVAYCLPEGYLDIREARYELSPNGDQYLDLMLRAFKSFRAMDPKVMFPRTLESFETAVTKGLEPVFTDIRSPEEVRWLLEEVAPKHDLILWCIARQGYKALQSDCYMMQNLDRLGTKAHYIADLYNGGTLEALRHQVQTHLYNLGWVEAKEPDGVLVGHDSDVLCG